MGEREHMRKIFGSHPPLNQYAAPARPPVEEWQRPFLLCRRVACAGPVSDGVFKLACRDMQQKHCSPACRAADELDAVRCCPKAERSQCVCTISTTCPDHGRQCHGTHD